MRFLILKDKLISDEQLNQLELNFSDFISGAIDITPQFFVMDIDYRSVPVEADYDGDLKPTTQYLTELTDKVHKVYGTWGVDSVVMLVHRDNWKFDGIWGTNISNVYHQYHFHLCRFDNRNIANSLGTLYHEWMHSLDSLIKTHTGVEIDDYFKHTKCFYDWDTTVIHGNRFRNCKETPYTYIKWKENVDALKMIAPDLKKAYKYRKEMYLAPYRNVQLQIISWLRSFLTKKDGVPK